VNHFTHAEKGRRSRRPRAEALERQALNVNAFTYIPRLHQHNAGVRSIRRDNGFLLEALTTGESHVNLRGIERSHC
jgi:hypothetical protein